MRRVRYYVAMSLDAYIAGPKGEYDWIIMDPAIDFGAFFETIDTMLMGRKTFEITLSQGSGESGMPKMRTYVFSRTLRADDHPEVTIVNDAVATVAALRAEEGKDIWLMGGGVLFHSLIEADLVDTVEIGVIPILLGQGIPLLPAVTRSVKLELTESQIYPSGIAMLRYAVRRAAS